jgi:hypothetical protein
LSRRDPSGRILGVSSPDDRDFARYRATGDAAALAAVFDRTAPKLLLLASHWTRDPATAEDLQQSVKPGNYKMTVYGGPFPTQKESFTVGAGEHKEFEFTLPATTRRWLPA